MQRFLTPKQAAKCNVYLVWDKFGGNTECSEKLLE